ncbi:MAG: hypothetical protein QM773_10875 [Hyphomonadaceae bacterium]
MHRTGVRVGAVVLVCLASACASGPSGPPGGGPPGGPGGMPGSQLQEAKIARPVALLFTGMDTNRDLYVSSDELAKGIEEEFARADADRSGTLTGFEMADWCKAVMGDAASIPDLREMDTDMNYTVTPQEFATALKHQFERMDKNGDGLLTREEMLMDAPHFRMGGEGGASGGGGQRPKGGGGGRGGGGRGPGGGGGGSPPF